MSVPTNRYKHMALACKVCGHRPAPDSVMEATLLHFQVDHDTDQIEFDLVAVCDCGAAMKLTESRPTGGGFKDWFVCPACGAEGYVYRGPGTTKIADA